MAPDKPHDADREADWYGGDIGSRPGDRSKDKPPDRRSTEVGGREEEGGEDNDSKPNIFQNPLFKIGIAVVVILAVIVAIVWWLVARNYEDTDDAFIDTHIVHVSPQIAGQVIKIYVNDNQHVHAGQPLVEIDSRDALARLAQARAQEMQAETQYTQAVASERASAAQAVNAGEDLARYRALQRLNAAAVAQQQIDQATAAAQSATAQRDASKAQIATAAAAIKLDKAQVAAAQLNLGYTHIVSPVEGHVTQRSVALGNYVAPGQEMMAIVPLQMWVTANFKETQLALMRVGQPVTVTVDACRGTLKGHVDSIQRGAGQAFGILPPENATGNYVKVVQRVPVKIVLDKLPANCPIGPGMSVEPSVRVR